MASPRTALVPLADKTGEHRHLLEVVFQRRLRLALNAPFSATETLARAGIDFAAECATQAQRLTDGGRLHDVAALVARPTANIVAEGAWLGLILGMVMALEDCGPSLFAASGQVVGGGERLADVEPESLARKLSVLSEHLERHSGPALPVLVPARTVDGVPVRSACAGAVSRLQDCGGRLLVVDNLADAFEAIRHW